MALYSNPQSAIQAPGARAGGRPGDRVGINPADADIALRPVGVTRDGFKLALSITSVTAVSITLAKASNPDQSVTASFAISGASDAARAVNLATAMKAHYTLSTWIKNVDGTTISGSVTFDSKLDEDVSLSIVEAGGSGEITATTETAFSAGSDVPYGYPVYTQGNGTYGADEPGAFTGGIQLFLAGIAVRYRIHNTDEATTNRERFASTDHLLVRRKGKIFVNGGNSASSGDPVYAGVDADGERGQFFTASGGARELIPAANAKWVRPNVIEIDLFRV